MHFTLTLKLTSLFHLLPTLDQVNILIVYVADQCIISEYYLSIIMLVLLTIANVLFLALLPTSNYSNASPFFSSTFIICLSDPLFIFQ